MEEFLDKDGVKGERGLHDPFGLIEALFGGNIIEHLHGRPFRGGYSCITKKISNVSIISLHILLDTRFSKLLYYQYAIPYRSKL